MNSKYTFPQLVIIGVVTVPMINQLNVHYSRFVSYAIGAVARVLIGLLASFLYKLA